MSFLNPTDSAKKLCSIGFLIFSFLFIAPQKAQAQYFDVVNSPKEIIGDTFAWTTAKRAVKKVTADTVSWINSGFKGNPAYITNPDQFFLNAADQTVLQFINGTALNRVCSPFRPNLRLALVRNYLRETDQNFSCTLGSIEQNFEGFTNNFEQGGWDSWFNVTQNSSSNPYGSYLDYRDLLAIKNSGQKENKKADINQGQGFLSWKECRPGTEQAAATSFDMDQCLAEANGWALDPQAYCDAQQEEHFVQQ